jgi:Leucine-rich repeat (LRR) protein
MSVPNIRLVGDDRQWELPGDSLLARSVPVPAEIARFEGQVAVFLEDILSGQSLGQQICCVSPRGETFAFPAAEVSGYSLLSTNTPSWKLVPAGRTRLHEITVPRFVLREVTRIELGTSSSVSGSISGKVYSNLTDALMQPESVRFLALTSAGMERFPTGVFELLQLESLNLGKNSIEVIPPEIGTLRNLKVLKLSRNRLRTLPEEIGRLKQLTELHVSRNEIDHLPERLWNLDRLELINLGENRLRSMPPGISQLTALRSLELSGNPIPNGDRPSIQALIPQVSIEW